MDARLWAAGEDQAYNLSLGPSTHDLMVTVTSTQRGPITPGVIGEGPGLRNIASTSLRACACVCTACVPRWHPSGAFEYTRRRHLSRHRATDTDWRANDTLRTLHSARANLTQARQPPLSESARFRPTKPDNEGISLYCAQDYNPISGPTSSTNQSSEFRVYSSLE